MDSRDLIQLVKSKIEQNGKYWNAGLFIAAAMGILKFVFTRARHLIGIGRVQHKSINATTVALQGNYCRSN